MTKYESERKIVVLDPGHFHASLLQKNPLASVNDTIRVYAPEGAEVKQYLNDINSYNQRAENPTSWKEEIYIGGDYLSRMLSDRQGDVVVLAGNNQKKQTIFWKLSKQDTMCFPTSLWPLTRRISTY